MLKYIRFFRLKVAPHESPTSSQPSSGEGESTPEESGDGHLESSIIEQPLSLSDLLG